MSDSMFGSLLNMLDKHTVGEVASALGQPQTSVARGMESSIAAILGGLAGKAEDTGALRRILDIVPSTSGPISWAQIASGVADPDSSFMAIGKRLLPSIFGSGEKTVTSAISRESALPSGTVATLLSMAAPVVMSFISKQVRDGGMTMGGLAAALQRESATIKRALPAGLGDLFWPTRETASTVSPVVAQTVQKETSSNWLPVLAIAGLGLGLLWFLAPRHRPTVAQIVPSVPIGTANRFAVPVAKTCVLPANVKLPEGGAAARLLTFIQSPESRNTTWFTMDQIAFDSGSATLKPASQTQLNNIATVLNNCPGVRLDIAGYTDNVGSAESNLRLSRNRANSVVAVLVKEGVPRERFNAEGYGEEDPVADNSIEQGRAQNRRVAMRVAP
uniref:OmpA/MotB domain protein n=1 Tax=Solibacter usitatus (strain Ellin6076) TaxID=234267 RepID=Q01WW6_SOLUE